MNTLLQNVSANLTDMLVYAATAAMFVIGLIKCVFPVRANAHRLRRGVRMLESMPSAGDTRPVWQDTLFLGKKMETPWRRFLHNAEQLDARGLSCNLDDYVNDDTVIYSVGHVQLGEIIPGLLTSLGILGTFIGLIRGLGGLDVSDAAKTMESIPDMIGGMTFAFTTSIVGVACSLLFNIFNRMALGSATAAIDEFQDAFADLVMQRPLDENVLMICQQQDRDVMLRRMSGEMANRVASGVQEAVERTLVPVTQQMNQFIMAKTQSQVEGVAQIANQFVAQMNRVLGGQLLQLGETLSQINQSQAVNQDALQRTMLSADQVMENMNHIQQVTERILSRFEGYIRSVEDAQHQNDVFLTHGSQVLSGMLSASDEQSALIEKLRSQQREMLKDMRDYAEWSGRVLSAVQDQAKDTQVITKEMKKSAEMLSGSYSSFVQNIGSGLNKSVGLFDENINSILNLLNERLIALRKTAEKADQDQGLVREISLLQRTMTDISQQLDMIGKSLKGEKMA